MNIVWRVGCDEARGRSRARARARVGTGVSCGYVVWPEVMGDSI